MNVRTHMEDLKTIKRRKIRTFFKKCTAVIILLASAFKPASNEIFRITGSEKHD